MHNLVGQAMIAVLALFGAGAASTAQTAELPKGAAAAETFVFQVDAQLARNLRFSPPSAPFALDVPTDAEVYGVFRPESGAAVAKFRFMPPSAEASAAPEPWADIDILPIAASAPAAALAAAKALLQAIPACHASRFETGRDPDAGAFLASHCGSVHYYAVPISGGQADGRAPPRLLALLQDRSGGRAATAWRVFRSLRLL